MTNKRDEYFCDRCQQTWPNYISWFNHNCGVKITASNSSQPMDACLNNKHESFTSYKDYLEHYGLKDEQVDLRKRIAELERDLVEHATVGYLIAADEKNKRIKELEAEVERLNRDSARLMRDMGIGVNHIDKLITERDKLKAALERIADMTPDGDWQYIAREALK